MVKTHRIIHTGDTEHRGGSSAREVDRLVTELGQLYLERFKVLRHGDANDLQIITDRIAAIKKQLKHL